MKRPVCAQWCAVTLLLCCRLPAESIAYEPFAYPQASPLTDVSGGTGWGAAWTVDGDSATAVAPGLSYEDVYGNSLITTGLAASTAGTATTRNFRTLAAPIREEVWISFLYRLPASNAKFEGVSFYLGEQNKFSVQNPSTDPGSLIVLGNNVTGGSISTLKGSLDTTHLIVLHFLKGGAHGGADTVRIYVDPLLAGNPSQFDAAITAANFDFDRVRIAGQDGSELLVDELRVGNSFAEVTPWNINPDLERDSDNDGLTDAQELLLGLDPFRNDSALIQAISDHPDFFGLHTRDEIMTMEGGGRMYAKQEDGQVNATFEIQHSVDLIEWTLLESVQRPFTLPANKNFLSLTIELP